MPVIGRITGVSPVNYDTVIRLDGLIRHYPTPSFLRIKDVTKASENVSGEALLQRLMANINQNMRM